MCVMVHASLNLPLISLAADADDHNDDVLSRAESDH